MGTSPTGVVVGGGKVYVSNLDGTVAVISAASNTVTGHVTVGAPVQQSGAQCRRDDVVRGHPTDTVVAIDVATATVMSDR